MFRKFIDERHIQFLETLCERPIMSNENASKSYTFLKKKGLQLRVTTVTRNTARGSRKVKNELFERKRFRIYWVEGQELEVIDLFHKSLNYRNIQWRGIYVPILGKEYTDRLKASKVKKPTCIDKRFAKILPALLDEKRKESVRLIEEWIEEHD
jgi:hypothetical protein